MVLQSLKPWAAANAPFHIELHTASSRGDILRALNSVRIRLFDKGHCPIVHIEAHGDQQGLQLANGDVVEWEELREVFTTLNRLSRFNLLLFMAMCEGWWLSRTLTPMKPSPCWGVIGPTVPVGDRTLLKATTAFYGELLGSFNAWKAVEAMNQNAPANSWRFLLEAAEVMYCRVCASYTRTNATPAEVEDRVNAIVAHVVRGSSYDLRVGFAARVDARRMLSNPKDVYDGFRQHFFMLEEIPENRERFTLSYEDSLKYL